MFLDTRKTGSTTTLCLANKGGNPDGIGTKVAAHYLLHIEAGKAKTVRLRFSDVNAAAMFDPFANFDSIFQTREKESDEFYQSITPRNVSEDEALVMHQALSGMLWSKQYFNFNLKTWLTEHGADPALPNARQVRNAQWFHMINEQVISMPDKWEYPWYAAWDLAFHTLALSTVDPKFAKNQLELLLHQLYQHPTGQLPAYE